MRSTSCDGAGAAATARPETRSRGAVIVLVSAVATALLVALTSAAHAHPLAPALLEISEVGGGRAEVVWTTPSRKVRGADFRPLLPEHCRALGEPQVELVGAKVKQSWTVECGESGFVGHAVGVDGLASAYTDALVRLELADGRSMRAVVRASEPLWTVPERESRLAVARGYMMLGSEHILTGWDHLLFVFGLLLLVRGVRPLVKTVTAFTVGHSITLSLAVLGYAPLSPRPIEFAIALSIFVLAVELTRDPHGGRNLIRRYPWLIAGLFGLLHGAGFAGALSDVGLPQHEIPLALFSFNVGIELGQLVFIATVLTARALLGARVERLPAWMRWAPTYALGCLAVYWSLQRLVAWLA